MKILVIADTHISPSNVEDSESLWYMFAQYCCIKAKPDVIVHLGDVADFNSQAWRVASRGVNTFEEEMEAVDRAVSNFNKVFEGYNRVQRLNHKRLYRPRLVLTLGNHDVRNGITAVAEYFEHNGWSVYGYLEPVQIDGITFVHCAHNGLSDTVCTTAQELVENWHSDIVVGHGHHKDYFESFSYALDKPIFGMRCPCFMMEPSTWAVQTRNKWSLGFTEIDTESRTFIWRNLDCLYRI